MKSFFIPLTEPLGAIWLLMAAGTVWLLVRRQWRSVVWIGAPTFMIFLVGSTPLAEMLVARMEQPYTLAPTAISNSRYNAVVVLGGGFSPSDYDDRGFVLKEGASRVLTGIELARKNSGACLVLGGSVPTGDSDDVVSAKLQGWVESLRLTSVAVTNLGICSDTHDEAVAFKRLQETHHWSNVLLVTSALHMPRSEALFKRQGIPVTPVGCDFRACGTPKGRFTIFPRQNRFDLLAAYLHEKIGMAYYLLKGWV